MNSTTNTPLQATIQLWVGPYPNNGSTLFGNYSTNTDGTFDITSFAEWNGDEYYLLFMSKTNINGSGAAIGKSCNVAKNKKLDIGNILF